MPDTLLKMERRILDYIVDYLRRNTYQPSIREIGKKFGIKSTKTVSEYLQALAEKGYIEREASRSRGVKIVNLQLHEPASSIRVPLYSKIAAGQPALLEHEINEEFTVDPRLGGSPEAFFLLISGDSMKGLGMLEGDLVLVEPAREDDLTNGDVVAARLGGEATVKRYFSRDGTVVLEPANVDYAPMLVHEYADFQVLGRVSGLFRRFTREQTEAIGG
ncbi:transcriptional repressor LexA [soil metagenome]